MLLSLYLYIKNIQQAKDVERHQQPISIRDSRGDANHTEDLMKTLDEGKSNLALNIANVTLYAIEKLYKKVFPLSSTEDQPQLKVENLDWLDRSGSKEFSDYGDGSCPANPNKKPWQNILNNWIRVAKEHDIRYFLTAGSLLGAWRDEEVIPYDADMDIRVHIDDFDKLFPLRQKKFVWESNDDYDFHIYFTRDWRLPYNLRRRFSCKGKRVYEYEGQCSFTDPTARMIYRNWHLDLYAFTTYQDTVKFMPHDAAFEYRKEDILPVTRCMFMGIETRCPQKPTAIFKNLYGSIKPLKKCVNKSMVRV